MSLQTWIIEPRDSLIARDGKPFGANVAHATTLDFPFPSTTTGGVRTRAGIINGKFDVSQIDSVKNIEVRGALLAELDQHGEISDFYLPSPADALLLQSAEQREKNEAQLHRFLPLDTEKLSGDSNNRNLSNLPEQIPYAVGLTRTDNKDKPFNDLKFWSWKNALKPWVTESYNASSISLNDFGIKGLIKDARVHVAINENLASVESALFQTRGLEFNYGDGDLSEIKKLSLVVFVDDSNSQKLEDKGNLSPLGGERRLVSWRKSNQTKLPFDCPPDVRQQIVKDGHCRLMLLTPGFFESGLPESNADYEIKAVASNRYQTVSGWDFETNQPKPTRRLVPAGSILFLQIKTDVEKWIENTWMNCIGDSEEEKKAGFGLSILGTWDGKALKNWE